MPSNSERKRSLTQSVPLQIIENFVPGIGVLAQVYSEYFGVDITIIFSCLALAWMSHRVAKAVWTKFRSLALQCLTSSISISSSDPLYSEVIEWIFKHVLGESSRSINARTTAPRRNASSDGSLGSYPFRQDMRVLQDDSIRYHPNSAGGWFFFRGRLIMILTSTEPVKHFSGTIVNGVERHTVTPTAHIMLMTPGFSTTVIKQFLKTCRTYVGSHRASCTDIYTFSPEVSEWEYTATRRARPLSTVDLDDDTKEKLIKDVKEYLSPSTRLFYALRGIPYRRGYLFYGPPGTGKTSLSVALAGEINANIYMISLSAPFLSDADLSHLFSLLPPSCIVLLEDIDVATKKVRTSRLQGDEGSVEYNQESLPIIQLPKGHQGGRLMKAQLLRSAKPRDVSHPLLTLSGLLNVIDGVASKEGRVLIMTTNNPEDLDPALIRPGRIDLQVRFGFMSKTSAAQIFKRFYTPTEEEETAAAWSLEEQHFDEIAGVDVSALAATFAGAIPEDSLTPAEVQGFLLTHKKEPMAAASGAAAWASSVLAARIAARNVTAVGS